MQPFTYSALPSKIVFGFGTISNVRDEILNLGCRRALLVATPSKAVEVARLQLELGDLAAGVFAEVAMHTPVDVTGRALEATKETGADCIVAVGGGSAIGLGKAIALHTDLPQVAIPTTYAGSEATPVLGQTENGVKTTQRTLKVLPEVVIYDADLTLSLPVALTVTSSMNAIAHAAEGLYAKDANPVTSLIAEDGLRALAGALPLLIQEPLHREARSDALYGAWACGVTLGTVGMALHHKLCHILGGSFNLPHAQTHTVLLPHALAYNAEAAPDAMARIARAIGAPDAPTGLFDLCASLGAPASLAALGMPREGLDRVVELTLATPYWNPAPLDASRLRHLLEDAFEGNRPPETV